MCIYMYCNNYIIVQKPKRCTLYVHLRVAIGIIRTSQECCLYQLTLHNYVYKCVCMHVCEAAVHLWSEHWFAD